MAVEGCAKCMKYCLVAFNFLVVLAGGAAIGLGIYTLVSDFGAEEMSEILGNDLYKAGSIVLIVGGGIVFIIAFFGCCGACMESKCLLVMYFTIMLLLLIVFVVAAILGFVFRDQINDEIEEQLEKTLRTKYGVNLDKDENEAITDAWNKIQKEFDCCGVSGGRDSLKSWAFYKLETSWYKLRQSGVPYVPDSCCNEEFPNSDCILGRDKDAPPLATPGAVTASNPAIWEKGCKDKFLDEIEKNALIIGIIGAVIILVMVLGVLFSLCLCLNLRKQSMVV